MIMEQECQLSIPAPTKPETAKVTARATWIVAFVAFTGTWHFGYSIGSVNAACVPLTKFIRMEFEDRYQSNVSSEFVDAIWVTTSAIFPIGGLFGSFVIGPLITRFGRLRSILFCHVAVVILSAILGVSKLCHLPELVIFARFGLGVTSGAGAIGICPMYVAEVSPMKVRGKFGVFVGTGISVGIFGANTLGLPSLLSNDAMWPLLFALTGVPSFLFIALFKTLPESPRQLYFENGETEKATEVLRKVNGITDVSSILNEMAKEKKCGDSSTQLTIRQIFSTRSLMWPLIASSILAAAQQLTGVNGIAFNMNKAFVEAGLTFQIVPYATMAVSGSVIFINLACAFLTEKYGRKAMLCLGYSLEAVSLLMISIFMKTQHMSAMLPYMTVVSSIGWSFAYVRRVMYSIWRWSDKIAKGFFCGFGLGGGCVTHVIIPELFDQASRSAGMMISSAVIWISFALCAVVTPYMLAYIGGYTFVLFCILAVATVAFTAWRVPETRNKSFAEIKTEFNRK